MKTKTGTVPPPVTRLADYTPPAFHISETVLDIELDFSATRVNARHTVRREKSDGDARDLVLDVDGLELDAIAIDGKPLTVSQYRTDEKHLVVMNPPDEFELTIANTIHPDKNTALSGLYQSADMLCTQCEAEGFRRITPAIDRPDNLGRYTVTLRADKKTFPQLLCNGNLTEAGDGDGDSDGDGDKHFATWHDPFPKPTYLFAIVAGRLECYEDSFTTRSGREVALRFFTRPRDITKCAHAMASLKRAMAWDEKVYGREYDLDLFNVVAVEDFNMGAMENKSLNIFNTQYVLADPHIATDDDFENVEAVIGHEYFHNWSGNRVTCRDWFQLSLKEGFTVFREQQFSADMGGGAVKRINDVALLRSHQFREDAGPMAHPVRPDSYIEINNFYTATVYNKGAEVIRMLHTLLGEQQFRRATDLYFDRHDGQAVTTDDFVAAMESTVGINLSGFNNWYTQAGTPVVEAQCVYDAARKRLEITLSQHCPPTPQQPDKSPFVIPVKVALFDRHGARIAGDVADDGGDYATVQRDDLLVLSARRQTFVINNVPTEPVVSLLREFSAPVELRQPLGEADLALLLANDDDPFNRWEAGQKLLLNFLLAAIAAKKCPPVTETISRAFESVLNDTAADPALRAEILTPPDHAYICEQLTVIDPRAVFNARHELKRQLAHAHREKLLAQYHELNARNDGGVTAAQIGIRSLRNTCLHYLMLLDDDESHELAAALLTDAHCMTDSAAALSALANSGKPDKQDLLDDFYRRHADEPLIVDKWLRIQATVPSPDTLTRVEALTAHDAFDAANPNKVYALLAGFSHGNPFCFHADDGDGYRFIRHWVAQLDPTNPQLSARLTAAFVHWKKYIPALKTQMHTTLEDIAAQPKLSPDVAEIVSRSLEN